MTVHKSKAKDVGDVLREPYVPERGKGGKWLKGVSGNPAGPPRGYRHVATRMAERLMSEDVQEITAAVIRAAKDGDMTACKIVLDRIYPVPRAGDDICDRISKIEKALGIAVDESGHIPQLLESDDGYQQGSPSAH